MKKTHGTIEEVPYIDSMEITDPMPIRYNDGRTKYYEIWNGFDEIEFIAADEKNNIIVNTVTKTINANSQMRYFICPSCGKMHRKLYLTWGNNVFECRKCARLNYRSQQEAKDCFVYYDQGMEYARDFLGFEKEDAYPMEFPSYTPNRPKGMKWATYERHLNKFRWYQQMYQKVFEEKEKRILENYNRIKRSGL